MQNPRWSTTPKALAALLLMVSLPALAEECLNNDSKRDSYADGDARHSTYVKCTPGAGAGSYGALNAIGQQMQGMLGGSDSNDRGYSDAEREQNRRELQQFAAEQDQRRAQVKYGATVELEMGSDLKLSSYQFDNATISAAQQQAIRSEISTAINTGKLIETYGQLPYDSTVGTSTWAATDPATRWKTCEVATQLVRAYAFGEFIKPEQKNPARGLAIAKAGYSSNCGGTAYWLGRIYEAGDALVPGIDKNELGHDPKRRLIEAYDIAILNGYGQAYERMAELYRLNGPARYQGKTYYSFPIDFDPYWPEYPRDDAMYMQKVQYSKCLQAEPANLVCARGLRSVYSNTRSSFDYSTYNQKLAAFYDDYVKKLEGLLAQAGQPVPAETH
jgi:hypothetical protein